MEERERTTAQLRASEERFRQLAENIEDVFFVQNADRSRTLYVSPAYERIWGQSAEVQHDPQVWLARIHPDDRERTRLADQAITAALPQPGALQFRIVRPDGALRWIMTRIFPIQGEGGEVRGVVGVATDWTNRKVAEDDVLKLNRVYAMLSSINALIVRVADRDQLLREACRVAVEQGGFKAAWCGLAEHGGAVTQAAAAGELLSAENPAQAERIEIGAHRFVAGAIAAKQPVAANDLASAGSLDPLTRTLLAHGCRALAALPLIVAGESVGCLVLMSAESGVFDGAELRLLEELGGDISLALDHIDKAERLNYLAYYDSITGLANRTFLQERLAQHIRGLVDQQELFAVVIVDIEDFDSLNDTLGRSGGDEVLREFADRLVRELGPGYVARSGADEFAVVIPRPRSIMEVTRTVEGWLAQWPTLSAAGQRLTLRLKAGIALFPNDGMDAVSLLRSAEAAMKNAKLTQASYAFFTPQLARALHERRTLESSLRRALDDQELVLYYQPKVELDTRRVVGVEALMRWQHPERGLVLPATFIPLMEDTGLIVEAGLWALRQARADRARWLAEQLPAPRVAVTSPAPRSAARTSCTPWPRRSSPAAPIAESTSRSPRVFS
jgi:diguanylate cyclase (GGDEF)-like protein/PAS domain S-box-containing protein